MMMEVIMNDLFRTLSRTSNMPVKRCERCGNIADNIFYVRKGNRPHERVSHDLCESCANWLCNFIAFFVTVEDDKLEEIEDIVSYDNPVYEAFVEEFTGREQKGNKVEKIPEKPVQKASTESGIKNVPSEVIEAADAFFGALAENAAPIKDKSQDEKEDENSIKPVIIPIGDFLKKNIGEKKISPKQEVQEAPIVTRIKKLIADCKDDDFDTALKKITSFVGGLTIEEAKEFKKHECELKEYFLGK